MSDETILALAQHFAAQRRCLNRARSIRRRPALGRDGEPNVVRTCSG